MGETSGPAHTCVSCRAVPAPRLAWLFRREIVAFEVFAEPVWNAEQCPLPEGL
jgi:hypothetical protein